MKISWVGAALLMGTNSVAYSAPQATIDAQWSARIGVTVVTQPDGKVIERLAMNSAAAARQAAVVAPDSPEAWLEFMLDSTRNGQAFKNPKLIAEWLDAVTEPRFMTALATVVFSPGTYPRVLGRLVDPATVHNWAEFMDPNLFLSWMAAGLDPRFSEAIYLRMANPQKYLRWAAYAGTPEARGVLVGSLNPENHGKWSAAGLETNNHVPIAKAANLVIPSAWVGGFADGANHALASDQSAQVWLKLPTPDPKSNPYLSGNASYRY